MKSKQYYYMRYWQMNHKKQVYTVLCILVAMVLSGCGSKKYDLTRSPFMTGLRGDGKIVVAVSDERSFVLNGEEESTYIGRHFNAYGVPAKIFTRSGRTLAEDVSELVSSSLKNNGFDARSVFVGIGEDLSLNSQGIADHEYDRAIIMRIKKLKAETFAAVELEWSLTLEIYDNQGEMLASSADYGTDDAILRNYAGIVSGRQGLTAVTGKLGGILMKLFSAPDVKAALASPSREEYAESEKQVPLSGQNEAQESEQITVLKRYLKSGESASFRNYSIQIGKQPMQSQLDLDQLAEIIWTERNSKDSSLVDGLCHLCKTFMRSRQPRYRSIFERIKEEGGTRKIRGYASKTLKYILPVDVPQFIPNEAGDQNRLVKYLLSTHQVEAMNEVGMFWDEKLGHNQDCISEPKLTVQYHIPLEPISFSEASEHPVSGMWIQRFLFQRCGESRVLNALFKANDGKEPLSKPYAPGTTNAGPQLLNDAIDTAKILALLKLRLRNGKNSKEDLCDHYLLVNTEETEPPHDVNTNGKVVKGVWSEEWTWNLCGEIVTVSGVFTPASDGGTSFNFK